MHCGAAGNRQRDLEEVAAERHAAAEIAVRPEVLHEARSSPELVEHGRAEGSFLVVDDLGVEYDEVRTSGLRSKQLANERQLVVEPDVVLIGEDKRVAMRVTDGVLEVAEWAAERVALEQSNAVVGESAHDRHGAVGRRVVGDDELVTRFELGENRLDLPAHEAGAVEGRHADRDHAVIVLPRRRRGLAGRGPVRDRGYTFTMDGDPIDAGAETAAPVDVEALFQALRDEVRRSGADPGGGGDPDDRRAARAEAERLWPVSADRSLRLRPGVRGGIGTPVKAVLRKAMRWYVEPVAYDQRSFNAATLRLIDDLQEQVDRLERELAAARDETR